VEKALNKGGEKKGLRGGCSDVGEREKKGFGGSQGWGVEKRLEQKRGRKKRVSDSPKGRRKSSRVGGEWAAQSDAERKKKEGGMVRQKALPSWK